MEISVTKPSENIIRRLTNGRKSTYAGYLAEAYFTSPVLSRVISSILDELDDLHRRFELLEAPEND